MKTPSTPYSGYSYPREITMYYRFTLSYRNVEELLATRGINVTYEIVRQWYHKFGQRFANVL